jgi:hypothetical protein
MSRTIRAILLIAVLATGGGFIAVTAYQAGINSAVTTAITDGAIVVAPLPAYAYGYGYPGGFGFGFFGFLGTLLFLFLFFGLIRALAFRGGPRRHGPHGGWGSRGDWGSRGGWGPGYGPVSSSEPPAPNPPSKPA